jgi:hypothetical protein
LASLIHPLAVCIVFCCILFFNAMFFGELHGYASVAVESTPCWVCCRTLPSSRHRLGGGCVTHGVTAKTSGSGVRKRHLPGESRLAVAMIWFARDQAVRRLPVTRLACRSSLDQQHKQSSGPSVSHRTTISDWESGQSWPPPRVFQ